VAKLAATAAAKISFFMDVPIGMLNEKPINHYSSNFP
jgi:hypothetical protein